MIGREEGRRENKNTFYWCKRNLYIVLFMIKTNVIIRGIKFLKNDHFQWKTWLSKISDKDVQCKTLKQIPTVNNSHININNIKYNDHFKVDFNWKSNISNDLKIWWKTIHRLI